MKTQVVRLGNTLVIALPEDTGILQNGTEVEIERSGDFFTLKPIEQLEKKIGTLAGLMDAFASFPPDFMADGREFHEQAERDWSGLITKAVAPNSENGNQS